jgi:hypothetical protein
VIWARLHGLVSLEINDNVTSLGVDPGPLYADAVTSSRSGSSRLRGDDVP